MNLPTYSAVIFDMDGVLVNTEEHFRSVDHTFLQTIIPSWSAEDQRAILGMSIDRVFTHVLERGVYSGSREAFLAHYEGLASHIFGSAVELYPDAASAIRDLSGYLPLGLCSSSPHRWIDRVLTRFDLQRHFSVVVSAEDVAMQPKPAPQIYLKACELLNLPSKQCVAVEDTAKGIASAKGAGCFVVGYRNGVNDAQDFSACDATIGSLGELHTLIATLRRSS